jgi:hypothetical protein
VTIRSYMSMRVFLSIFMLGAVTALNTMTTPRAAQAATTLVVDADGQATATDCNAANSAFTTIQAAVNAAAPGDTIYICPGTYNEQVVVSETKGDLIIRGSGAGVTLLKPTAVTPNTTSILLGTQAAPILLINGAANVTIRSLTIDGSAADSGAVLVPNCTALPFYIGIYYRGGSGTVDTAQVTRITSGKACADAIRAENANVTVTTSMLDGYGRAGISCAGANAKCAIVGNMVRGLGPVNNQTQSGIQIRAAAAATISGNVVTDNFLIGAKGVPPSSVGIVLFDAQPTSNPHLVTQNVFANNQVNIQRQASAAAF